MVTPNIKKVFNHAEVQHLEPDSLVVRATAEYIPTAEFKEVFDFAGKLVKHLQVKRMIFDKRAMRVFDQPSMEWYFTDWKADMAELGMSVHRKILPEDFAFRESVKVGRKNIAVKYPSGKFHELDIQYAESLEEALSK